MSGLRNVFLQGRKMVVIACIGLLGCAVALGGCSGSDADSDTVGLPGTDVVDDAVAIAVEADLRNLAIQLSAWYAAGQDQVALVNTGGSYYLCAPEDVSNTSACTAVGPLTSGARFTVLAGGASGFCVQAAVEGTDAVWHQDASGTPAEGACT